MEADAESADSTALITGAGGAIGGAATSRFLELGVTVVGIDRNPPPGEGVHPRYRHVTVDLEDDDATQIQVDRALLNLPPLRHVVGVAGGALSFEPATQDAPEEITSAFFRASLEANLVTQFTVVRASLKHLGATAGEDRSVTMTSSFNGLSAQGMPAYSAAKAGIVGLMLGLVRPLGARGIRVNVVAPGTVRTARTEALWSTTPGHFERLEAGTAVGRLALPEDVAEAIVSLAVHLRHVTGQTLIVDGGQMVVHR